MAALEVAFNREIHTQSVTFESDTFQPSGLSTGGSYRFKEHLMPRHEYMLIENSIFAFKFSWLRSFQNLNSACQLLRQLHDLAGMEAELSTHQKKLSDIEAKLGEWVKKIEQELEELNVAAKGKELEYKNCINDVSLLEKSIKEHDNDGDGTLENLEQKIKATKSKLRSYLKHLKGHENEREKLVMKMEAVVQEKALLESELDALETLDFGNRRTEVSYLSKS